jgi:hypothetical protein
VYDVRVLSANYSSTDRPLSPASYAIDWSSTSSTTRRNQQTKYKSLLDALDLESDEYMKDVVDSRAGGDANGTIKYNSQWSQANSTELHQAVLPNTVEHYNQKEYINRATKFIYKLRGKEGITVTSLESEGWTKPTAQGKSNFE